MGNICKLSVEFLNTEYGILYSTEIRITKLFQQYGIFTEFCRNSVYRIMNSAKSEFRRIDFLMEK